MEPVGVCNPSYCRQFVRDRNLYSLPSRRRGKEMRLKTKALERKFTLTLQLDEQKK